MKRLSSLFLAALLAFAPVAQADLRASSGAFGPIAATSGTVASAVTGVTTVLLSSGVQTTAPNDTNEDILATINVGAGVMGPNGAVRIAFGLTTTNNANAKTLRVRANGIGGTAVLSQALASSGGSTFQAWISNANATGAQQTWGMASAGGLGALTYAATSSAVDTTGAFTIVVTIQKGTGTDTVTMNGIVAEMIH